MSHTLVKGCLAKDEASAENILHQDNIPEKKILSWKIENSPAKL
jgi:hypothetical protein